MRQWLNAQRTRQKAFLLQRSDGQEISAALVIPLGTVMSRLSRARKALRRGLPQPLQIRTN